MIYVPKFIFLCNVSITFLHIFCSRIFVFIIIREDKGLMMIKVVAMKDDFRGYHTDRKEKRDMEK